MPAVIALLFVLDLVAVAGVFKTDSGTNCGVNAGWECSHAWEQFFFVASIVLSVLLVAACFIWLIQWAEYGRRRIYGPDATDERDPPAAPGRAATRGPDHATRMA